MPNCKILIYGQVQGVGFRYWIRGKFRELGIIGEAWNNDDGTVGVEFSANEKETRELLRLIRQGPPLARVKKVVIL